MGLGHLLTRSGLTYPEVSSKVYHDSFCQVGNNVSLPWVIYYEALYLHVVSIFSCIPVICPKLVLFLIPLLASKKKTVLYSWFRIRKHNGIWHTKTVTVLYESNTGLFLQIMELKR